MIAYLQGFFVPRTVRTNKAGFTLIEVMLALAVAGIVIGGSFYIFNTLMSTAKKTKTVAIIRGVKGGIEQFFTDTDEYPRTLEDLRRQPEGEIGKRWTQPYIDKKPVDAWGRALVYRVTPDAEHPYELYSMGASGKKGKIRIDAWKL